MDSIFKVISSIWASIDNLSTEIASVTEELRDACSELDKLDVQYLPVLNEKAVRLNELVTELNSLLSEVSLEVK